MKIAVLGCGRIGSTFAFQLARVGHHDVTAVARPDSARLAQLHRDGGIVDVRWELAEVQVLDVLDEATPYDLVIVTLLHHQASALLPNLQRSAAKCVLFMCNTFHPERLRDAVGADRCAFGMAFVQATLDANGRLKAAIGVGGQRTLLSEQRWVDLFAGAGLPARIEPNMPLWLRCHVPLCVAFEAVSIAAVRRGGGASWREALALARGVHAGFGLVRGLGHQVYPAGKRRIDAAPPPALAALLWCLSRVRGFRDVLATGIAECRALVDAMVAAAPGAEAPVRISDIEAMKPLA